MSVRVRGVCRAARWSRWAAAAAALVWAVRLPAPPHEVTRHYPGLAPAALAHSLADYSTHPRTDHWHILEERSNYSRWEYRVQWSCGLACSGEAAITATAHGSRPRHGLALHHTVTLHTAECYRLPLLSYPRLCDTMEVVWEVEGVGAGSAVRERGAAWCGAGAVASGACSARLQHYLAHQRYNARLTFT